MQVLNRWDKEQLVIKLHQEGKTIRETAQQVHMSFKDIGTIIRKIDGKVDDDVDLTNKSPETKALSLFSSGKKPIDVAIELNLSASEVQNLLEEYWALTDIHELAFVYHEIKAYLPSFLKLFHYLKNNKMLGEKHIFNILKNAGDDLPQLTDRIQCLTNDVINLEGRKRNLLDKLILWNAQLSDLGNAIDMKNRQLKRMSK